MTAASGYPYLKAGQIFAPVVRVIRIGKIGAADPFPTVSGKIENAIGLAPFGKPPTGRRSFHPALKCARSLSGGSFPHGYFLPSVPRAAFSHSASVGKRLPSHAQYATAPYHEASTTG